MNKNKQRAAYVLGVGLTKFVKPRGLVDYTELGFEAGIKALLDAHITYDDVEMGIASYCYGDSVSGQRVFYQFGMTEIPILNVNNNCASGSTGISMARDTVSRGGADCVLVVGFEKMKPGSIDRNFTDREDPVGRFMDMNYKSWGKGKASGAVQLFANAAQEYIIKNGAKPEDFAEIARINHAHSKNNPYAQFQKEYSLNQILTGPLIQEPLTMTQCCPTSDGGAAAVIVSEAFLEARPHLRGQAALIAGQAFLTDAPSAFDGSAAGLVGAGLARAAVKEALRQANATIADVQVVELHDCFSSAEMIALDNLGLSEPGKAHELVRNKDITYGGRFVVNPSGGLLSKGHPLGATGLAQCAELVWQLRGWANNRLVPHVNLALAHNAGLGSAGFVTLYKRADGQENHPVESEEVAEITGLAYNPAVHAKGFSREQAESVRSKRRSEWALGRTLDKVSAKF
ncbi:hypothetical protein LTR84_008823 [Exophiala bonariae]|uniref:propanoyl-CoA C-acyltransferase n=1 Tax=Exophiala bonariae TaxID=1690606 RepID=A0AAV9MZ64_9EURO|nr:hypothetical protein LTR84_008823 [Exophiala bonariae]